MQYYWQNDAVEQQDGYVVSQERMPGRRIHANASGGLFPSPSLHKVVLDHHTYFRHLDRFLTSCQRNSLRLSLSTSMIVNHYRARKTIISVTKDRWTINREREIDRWTWWEEEMQLDHDWDTLDILPLMFSVCASMAMKSRMRRGDASLCSDFHKQTVAVRTKLISSSSQGSEEEKTPDRCRRDNCALAFWFWHDASDVLNQAFASIWHLHRARQGDKMSSLDVLLAHCLERHACQSDRKKTYVIRTRESRFYLESIGHDRLLMSDSST